MRELWQAQLGETGTYEAWKTGGALSTTEKAQRKVAEILAERGVAAPGIGIEDWIAALSGLGASPEARP